MKTIVNTFLCFFLMVSSAFALPYLQLDVSGGTYVKDGESIEATSDQFTLYALIDETQVVYPDDQKFYISIALPNNATEENFGSFSFGNKIYTFRDFKPGTPDKLPTHGIYSTFYLEHSFSLGELNSSNVNNVQYKGKANAYNSQNNPGSLTDSPSGSLTYAAFVVNVSDLHPDYQLHFDLYTYTTTTKKGKVINSIDNAPFSHDAESDGTPGSPVPEPATILLLGLGLIGLARIGRKKFL